jgi:phage-related protein
MADQREELQQTQDDVKRLQEGMLALRRAKEAATNPADIAALGKQIRATALDLAEAGMKANLLGKEVADLDQKSARAKLALAGVGAAGALAFAQIAAGVTRTVSVGAPAQFELWQRSTADLAAVVGQTLVPALEKLTEMTRSVADFFLNLDEPTQRVIVNFATFAVGLKLVATIAGPVLGALTAMRAGVLALNVALGATGAGAVLALVVGLLGLIAQGKGGATFAGLGKSLAAVGQAFGALFKAVEPIVNVLARLAQSVFRALGSSLQGVAAALSAVASLIGVVLKAVEPLLTFLANTIGVVAEGISSILGNSSEAGSKTAGRVGAGAGAFGIQGGIVAYALDLISGKTGTSATAGTKSSVGAAPIAPTFLSGEALQKKILEAGLTAGGKPAAERTADDVGDIKNLLKDRLKPQSGVSEAKGDARDAMNT